MQSPQPGIEGRRMPGTAAPVAFGWAGSKWSREHTHPVARPGAGQAASRPVARLGGAPSKGHPPGRGPACRHRHTRPVAKGAQPRRWRCGKATLHPPGSKPLATAAGAAQPGSEWRTRAPGQPRPAHNPRTLRPSTRAGCLGRWHPCTPHPRPPGSIPPPGVGVNGECHSVTNRSNTG